MEEDNESGVYSSGFSSLLREKRSQSLGALESPIQAASHPSMLSDPSFISLADRFFSKPDNFDYQHLKKNKTSNNKLSSSDSKGAFLLASEDLVLPIGSENDFVLDEVGRQQEHDALMKDISQREFLLRHTLSYWVSIFFMLGSCFFILGGCSQVWKLGSDGKRDAGSFIAVPFIVGGVAYSLGCYCGFWAVINLDRKDPLPEGCRYHKFRFFTYQPSLGAGYWSQLSYSIGGTWFFPGLVLTNPLAIAICFTLGSSFFTCGACFEISHNYGWHFRPSKLGWWISWSDLFGSLLFFIGSVNLFPYMTHLWHTQESYSNGKDNTSNDDNTDTTIIHTSDIPFLVGSCFFLFSSLGGLYMWKLEQFGNTYLPQLNLSQPSKQRSVKWYHLFFTMVYCSNITLSSVAASLSLRCNPVQLPAVFLRMMIPTGLLVLSSAIHMIPEGPPFSYLLWWLRITMLYQLVVDAFDITEICKKHDSDS